MTTARLVTFLLGSLWLSSAAAQQQPVIPQAQEQIERTIGSLFMTNINLNAQLAQAQAQIADLRKQIDEAKKVNPAK